jgi:hypothetical protein
MWQGNAGSPGSGGASPYQSRGLPADPIVVVVVFRFDGGRQTAKENIGGCRHVAGQLGKPRFGRNLTGASPYRRRGFLDSVLSTTEG